MNCNGDFCEIEETEEDVDSIYCTSQRIGNGLTGEAKYKLLKWLRHMEPVDYDAPGSTVREQGV